MTLTLFDFYDFIQIDDKKNPIFSALNNYFYLFYFSLFSYFKILPKYFFFYFSFHSLWIKTLKLCFFTESVYLPFLDPYFSQILWSSPSILSSVIGIKLLTIVFFLQLQKSILYSLNSSFYSYFIYSIFFLISFCFIFLTFQSMSLRVHKFFMGLINFLLALNWRLSVERFFTFSFLVDWIQF